MKNQSHSSKSLLQEMLFRSYVEIMTKHKSLKPNDNMFLTDTKKLHGNTTLADIDPEFKKVFGDVAESMFGYIISQGFTLVPKN